MVVWLSSNILVGGRFSGTEDSVNSSSSDRSQRTSFQVSLSAMCSASVDESAVHFCLLDFHTTLHSPIWSTIPVVDLRSLQSPAQSASEKALSSSLDLFSLRETLTVPFKYLKTLCCDHIGIGRTCAVAAEKVYSNGNVRSGACS